MPSSINWDKILKMIENGVLRRILEIAVQIEGKLREKAPIGATGNLRQSFNTKILEDGKIIEIGSPLEYASYVEFGTRPHRPPFDPIRLWVERKIQPHIIAIGISYEEGKVVPGRAKMLKGDLREKAIKSMTWRIIKKIEKSGTKGQEYVRQSLKELNIPYEVQFYEGGAVFSLDVSGQIKDKAII